LSEKLEERRVISDLYMKKTHTESGKEMGEKERLVRDFGDTTILDSKNWI